MSTARCPDHSPVPSPAIPPAAEPTGHPRSEHEASLSLVAQLRGRIEAADTHLMRMLHLAEIGESCLANMHPQRTALEPCGRLLEQIRERIEWAREALITCEEREDSIHSRGSDHDGEN